MIGVDKEDLWKVLRIYGGEGKLVRAVKGVHEDAKADEQLEEGSSEFLI